MILPLVGMAWKHVCSAKAEKINNGPKKEKGLANKASV